MMDVLDWIKGVTAVAQMVKAIIDARKSGGDLNSSIDQIQEENETLDTHNLVIGDDLLKAFVKDISKSNQRLVNALNDPRYTPAQLDQEEEIAKKSICVHISKIEQFNGGVLPSDNLKRIKASFCSGA